MRLPTNWHLRQKSQVHRIFLSWLDHHYACTTVHALSNEWMSKDVCHTIFSRVKYAHTFWLWPTVCMTSSNLSSMTISKFHRIIRISSNPLLIKCVRDSFNYYKMLGQIFPPLVSVVYLSCSILLEEVSPAHQERKWTHLNILPHLEQPNYRIWFICIPSV